MLQFNNAGITDNLTVEVFMAEAIVAGFESSRTIMCHHPVSLCVSSCENLWYA